jgi:hypothetical protein
MPLSDEAFEHFKECATGTLPQAWLVSTVNATTLVADSPPYFRKAAT